MSAMHSIEGVVLTSSKVWAVAQAQQGQQNIGRLDDTLTHMVGILRKDFSSFECCRTGYKHAEDGTPVFSV